MGKFKEPPRQKFKVDIIKDEIVLQSWCGEDLVMITVPEHEVDSLVIRLQQAQADLVGGRRKRPENKNNLVFINDAKKHGN